MIQFVLDLVTIFIDFASNNPLFIYIMIFVLKTFEVTVATVRIILLTKGNKFSAAFISFFEVMLWLFLISTVLVGISEDPLKAVVYAAAFAFGQLTGSIMESKMAIGTARVEAIVIREHETTLSESLRDKGYAITIIKAQGMLHPRSILIFYVPRKKIAKLVKEIRVNQPNVVITVEDVKPLYGGYKRLRSRRK